MDVISGTIREFVYRRAGVPSGFVIDGGMEIHFSSLHALGAAPLLLLGARLEIRGVARSGSSGEPHLDAVSITNLDCHRSVNLHELPSSTESGTPLRETAPPVESASLIPTLPDGATPPSQPSLARSPKKSPAQRPSPKRSSARGARSRASNQQEGAARAIQIAYDGFHRTQALVAFLAILEFHEQALGPMLLEAKHTYEQACSNYLHNEFAVAAEFAAASADLLRSVEVVISRVFRSEPTYPRLVAPPEGYGTEPEAVEKVQLDFSRVRRLVARIHWLLENGTLPQEHKEQIRKIATCSGMFYEQGRRLLANGDEVEASYLASAAEAVAHSAEHVCKQNYIAHSPMSQLASSSSQS
jgi:hypothetical protein